MCVRVRVCVCVIWKCGWREKCGRAREKSTAIEFIWAFHGCYELNDSSFERKVSERSISYYDKLVVIVHIPYAVVSIYSAFWCTQRRLPKSLYSNIVELVGLTIWLKHIHICAVLSCIWNAHTHTHKRGRKQISNAFYIWISITMSLDVSLLHQWQHQS